jgi:hypothetical protein
MKEPTLEDLTRAELLELIKNLPFPPRRWDIVKVRSRHLNARAQAEAKKAQRYLAQMHTTESHAQWQHHWRQFEELTNQAHILIRSLGDLADE